MLVDPEILLRLHTLKGGLTALSWSTAGGNSSHETQRRGTQRSPPPRAEVKPPDGVDPLNDSTYAYCCSLIGLRAYEDYSFLRAGEEGETW